MDAPVPILAEEPLADNEPAPSAPVESKPVSEMVEKALQPTQQTEDPTIAAGDKAADVVVDAPTLPTDHSASANPTTTVEEMEDDDEMDDEEEDEDDEEEDDEDLDLPPGGTDDDQSLP